MLFYQLATLVAIGSLLAHLLQKWYKLRSAPGPFLASISDIWRAYYQYRGLLRPKLLELHRQLGPIVRYGVNSISISDPSAISIIYGSRVGFVTADSYKVIVGISNGKEVPSLVSTSDEAKHGALRRSVATAFSSTRALDYEPFIDQTIPDLVSALQRHETVDLAEMLLFYSMDAANRVSFNESLGCLDSENDIGGMIQLIRDRFNHWGWWSSIPGLERLVYRNPIAMHRNRMSKKAPSSMVATAVSRLKSRVSKLGESGNSHPDLLQKFIQASQDDPKTLGMTDIVSLLMSTISGAGDTTATTLTAIIFNLLKHPHVLHTLVSELNGVELSDPPAFAEVNGLPFLSAVIKESMRVFSTPTWPMERKVPKGGVAISGMHIPVGTSVGCMPAAVHFNRAVFGDDADEFRPARWLEAGDSKLRRMEAAHLGFSRGRRVCLGQHVAMLQMKKVVTVLVLKFKMTLVYPHASLDADMSPAVACLRSLHVKVEYGQ